MAKRDRETAKIEEVIKIETEAAPAESQLGPADDEPTELAVEPLRKWFVRVHKIEPATVEAADEEGAKAAYRSLRGFHRTIHPYEIRELKTDV